MRLLLIGGNGQVGHELRRALAPLGDVVVTTRDGLLSDRVPSENLDLAQPPAVADLVERVAPDVVVNAAAYTAVDRAEDEPGLAHRVNAESPGRIAEACKRIGAKLVHYSTDYVFDGQGLRPYREDDPTAPLGVYGASKLAGEESIGGSGAQHVILRTAWVYGLHGSNFLRTMLRLAGERDELRVVADQIGSPTPAWLIADVTAALLRGGIDTSGVFHLVAGGQTSWHGFAEAIMHDAGKAGLLTREPRVLPITTSEFPTRAARPAYSVLDTARLVEQFQLELPDWRSALAATLPTTAGCTR
ncbi:dTDP-4-dehydrorhamnose reductase [Novilysobacter avium]|uniref:dTDP-4-dehydrorhamnose reductase n=1 Tax=Novilysobacter avium TaxID=2781023 RepID=A0A7S6ZVH8_9GAMM|nr:dTDP-4-dehydrorhamnose reductase [Lysobacter avium]QOW22789.1 dTDP-4-dehydrorhamnose reductase [Lysobacter avium]